MNVDALHLDDFETPDTSAEIFIEYTNLNFLLERIIEFQDRKSEASEEQVRDLIMASFAPMRSSLFD